MAWGTTRGAWEDRGRQALSLQTPEASSTMTEDATHGNQRLDTNGREDISPINADEAYAYPNGNYDPNTETYIDKDDSLPQYVPKQISVLETFVHGTTSWCVDTCPANSRLL
ncbi:hypothetical protein F5B19DRAFT_490294 [Rostrohypoxylon terebratum]|nr:hypothetical protein F5B19DRAFT_490294 [Rostrohypoxylon terebratum]